MITFRCDTCHKLYSIPEVLDKNERELAIQFAACTFCGTPRNPLWVKLTEQEKIDFKIEKRALWERTKGLCDECGAKTTNKKWNLCENHYVAQWKKKHNYNKNYMRKWRKSKKKLLRNSVLL